MGLTVFLVILVSTPCLHGYGIPPGAKKKPHTASSPEPDDTPGVSFQSPSGSTIIPAANTPVQLPKGPFWWQGPESPFSNSKSTDVVVTCAASGGCAGPVVSSSPGCAGAAEGCGGSISPKDNISGGTALQGNPFFNNIGQSPSSGRKPASGYGGVTPDFKLEANNLIDCAVGNVCVAKNLCQKGLVLENGAGIFQVRSNQRCDITTEACCKVPPQISNTVTPIPAASYGGTPQSVVVSSFQPGPTPAASSEGLIHITPNSNHLSPGGNLIHISPQPQVSGVLQSTTPYPGCAAALKCVKEFFCTAEGVMVNEPVYLTREQQQNKVPLSDCADPVTGEYGKCCRDPNYKDPWPDMLGPGKIAHSAPEHHCGSSTSCIASYQCGPNYRVQPVQNCRVPLDGSSGVCCSSRSTDQAAFPSQNQPTIQGQNQPGAIVKPPRPLPSPGRPEVQPLPKPQQESPANIYLDQPQPGSPPLNISGQSQPGSHVAIYLGQSEPGLPVANVPGQAQPGSPATYVPDKSRPGSLGTNSPGQTHLGPYPSYSQQPNQPPQASYSQSQPGLAHTSVSQPHHSLSQSTPSQPKTNFLQPASTQPQLNPPHSVYNHPQPGYSQSQVVIGNTQPSQIQPQTIFLQQSEPGDQGLQQPTHFHTQPSISQHEISSHPIQPQVGLPLPSQFGHSSTVLSSNLQQSVPSANQPRPTFPPQPPSVQSGVSILSQHTPDTVIGSVSQIQVSPSSTCGLRRNNDQLSSQDGNTSFGEFPWQVLILTRENQSGICSGALVSNKAVLTAAHCVQRLDARDILVRAGDWKVGTADEPTAVQEVSVAAAVKHPNFQPGSLFNDLVLLLLSDPVVQNQRIDTICLPSSDDQDFSNHICLSTGWGKEVLHGTVPGSLHRLNLKVMDNPWCENKLRQTYLGKYFILNKSFTCASGDQTMDLCKIDVGGPLVCDGGDGHYVLVGVGSWDVGCSDRTTPSVFASTDVVWVNNVLTRPIQDFIVRRDEQNAVEAQQNLQIDTSSKPGFSQGYGRK